MRQVFGTASGSGILDYVCCWYVVAARYMANNRAIRAAFVSTNSITQGEQPGIFWATLRPLDVRLNFAHRTFSWISEARGRAHVHVVILGFALEDDRTKYIWDYDADPERPSRANVPVIGPYLVASSVALFKRSRPLNDVPSMAFGSMPNDDGNLLIEDIETVEEISRECPDAIPFIREIVCSREYLAGERRWCLWLVDAPPAFIRRCSEIRRRIQAVRQYRQDSTRETTQDLANVPSLFGEIRQPSTRYILVPRHSSETRSYIPLSYFDPRVVAHDSCLTMENASLFHFGVVHSAMHMAWVRTVCGRIKSDYRYSIRLVYNNFPWPEDVSDVHRQRVELAAQAVLDARARFGDATLADLYDPAAMPPVLREAHDALDHAVDRCYRQQPFTTERQRLEFLFDLYERFEQPLLPAVPRQRRRRPRS